MHKKMAKKSTLSVVMVVKNEEEHIGECLKRIQWADEIVILDNGSTDKTIQRALVYTKKIITDVSEFNDLLYNKAIQCAHGTWILLIDPDEHLSEELQTEIQRVIDEDSAKYNGYYIPFKHFFLGKWLRYGGWYPSYLLRLIRREYASVGSEIHGTFTLPKEETGFLKGHILHYGDVSIEQRVRKMNLYSNLDAKRLGEEKTRITLFTLFFPAFFRGFKSYVLRRGFLDGKRGFIRAVLLFYTTFLAYAKCYETSLDEGKSEIKEIQ